MAAIASQDARNHPLSSKEQIQEQMRLITNDVYRLATLTKVYCDAQAALSQPTSRKQKAHLNFKVKNYLSDSYPLKQRISSAITAFKDSGGNMQSLQGKTLTPLFSIVNLAVENQHAYNSVFLELTKTNASIESIPSSRLRGAEDMLKDLRKQKKAQSWVAQHLCASTSFAINSFKAAGGDIENLANAIYPNSAEDQRAFLREYP